MRKYLQLIGALVGAVFIAVFGEFFRDDAVIGLSLIVNILIISVAIPVMIGYIPKKTPDKAGGEKVVPSEKANNEEAVRGAMVNVIGLIIEAGVFSAYAGGRLLGGGTMFVVMAFFIAAAIQTITTVVLVTISDKK